MSAPATLKYLNITQLIFFFLFIKNFSNFNFDLGYGDIGFNFSFSVTLYFLFPYTAAVEEYMNLFILFLIQFSKKIFPFSKLFLKYFLGYFSDSSLLIKAAK